MVPARSTICSIRELRLLNSAGTVVAQDDNSAPDGRNALLNYTVPGNQGGTYYLEVLPSTATASLTLGEYVVALSGMGGALTPSTLANGTENLAYNQTLNAGGTTGTFTYSPTGGLPVGLTLSNSGVLSGTPTAVGSYTFAVSARDAHGDTAAGTYAVVINPPVSFISPAQISAPLGAQYLQTISATGGTGSLTFSAAGGLPPGLALSATGVLSGTATMMGTYTLAITASDALGASASQSETIVVFDYSPQTLPSGTANQPSGPTNQPNYDQTITIDGLAAPYSFSTAGSLPPGITLRSNGELSGIPTTAGDYPFTVTAANSAGVSVNISYTLTINPGLTLGPGFNTLWSFTGIQPESLMEDSNGNLFGTTRSGGPAGFGTIDEIPHGNSQVTTLATFDLTTGIQPRGRLVEDRRGDLFGMTINGGLTNGGTIFELKANSHTITTLGSFPGGPFDSDPQSGLIADSMGDLFGTVLFNGTYDGGYVFEVPSDSNTIINLASFNGLNGAVPFDYGGLTIDSSGDLFGTTDHGGTWQDGTVFELQKGSGTITTLASFNGLDGAGPVAGVIEDSSGNLFGTTGGGGTNKLGTVFELPAGTGTINTLVNFNGANGASPQEGRLVEDSNGNLFGTTPGKAYGSTVFEVAKDSNTITTLATSIDQDAVDPLFVDRSGNLWGTTVGSPAGTLFELSNQLPSGTSEYPYNETIAVSGGTGATTIALTSGALPSGLTLTTAGLISGTPASPGDYTFTLTATDGVGDTVSRTYSLAIYPAFSLVTVVGSSTVQAGSGVLVPVQAADAFGNPIPNYSNAPTTVTARAYGPGLPPQGLPTTVSINSNGLGLFDEDFQQAGNYAIDVTGILNDGGVGTSPTITVTAGPAAQLAFAAQPVNTPTGVQLPPVTVQVEDVYGNFDSSDNSDIMVLTIASGPGSFAQGSTTTATVTNGVATFNNLILVTPGTYQLSATVPGLYTGPASSAFTVLPLQVVAGSFTGTPTGFLVQFNTPLLVDAQTPALYGTGFGASAAVTPTVTLTQITGTPPLGATLPFQVKGSLFVNQATNTLTFVETDAASLVDNGTPLLPDGTYVVDITSSGPNGLQALDGGGSLDGTGAGTPGHDFTATFTVGAAAAGDDVLWVPATADGPGQALSAPGKNQIGGGYPVYLDDHGGTVNDVQATLTYDPTLLTVTPTKTSTFIVSVPSPGTAVLHYHALFDLPPGTATVIGMITATVPAGTTANPTPYRAKDLLQLSNVRLNGGSVAVVAGNALHLVAYVGDADGNGAYSGNDATLITRVDLQTDSGFNAYPLVDPVIVADTDGSGFIPSDATLQVNEAGVAFPTANLPIPPIPSGVHFQGNIFHAEAVTRLPAAQVPGRGQEVRRTAPAPLLNFFITDRRILDLYFARLEDA